MEKAASHKRESAGVVIFGLMLISAILNCVLQAGGLYSFEREGVAPTIACGEETELAAFSWRKYLMPFTCDLAAGERAIRACEAKTKHPRGDGFCTAEARCVHLEIGEGSCVRKYWYRKRLPALTLGDYLRARI